jgi:hypothetical protein
VNFDRLHDRSQIVSYLPVEPAGDDVSHNLVFTVALGGQAWH